MNQLSDPENIFKIMYYNKHKSRTYFTAKNYTTGKCFSLEFPTKNWTFATGQLIDLSNYEDGIITNYARR